MARFKSNGKKLRLVKKGRQTKWAPLWTTPKIFGAGRRVHPARQTKVKRHWKRTKLKV